MNAFYEKVDSYHLIRTPIHLADKDAIQAEGWKWLSIYLPCCFAFASKHRYLSKQTPDKPHTSTAKVFANT